MLTIFHTVLCADTLTDTRTGQVSYIKVIDGINTPQLPAVVRGAFIGMQCQATENTPHSLRIDLAAPDKTALHLKQFDISLPVTPQKVLVRLDQLIFTQQGMHLILISSHMENTWKVMASMPIIVHQAAPKPTA